ncbi:MAG: hypothetical protein QM627_12445 [Luteolibacter sp.]
MPEFYNPAEDKSEHGCKLPHWQQGEVMQFVTFRLRDSMPVNRILQWKEKLKIWTSLHPKPWTEKIAEEYHRRFVWKLEGWLDEGHGSCLLKDASARKIGKGSIWQKNYRDTLIRDAGHFANAVRDIRRNPSRLFPDSFTLWQSERAKAIS